MFCISQGFRARSLISGDPHDHRDRIANYFSRGNVKFGKRGPSRRVLSLAVHPPLGDLPSAAFLFSFNKGPDSFLQCVISYFKCSLTQLSKSTDNTINTWYLCSSVTADPRPPSAPPLPSPTRLLSRAELSSSFWAGNLLSLCSLRPLSTHPDGSEPWQGQPNTALRIA